MSDTAGSRSDRTVDQLLLEAVMDDDGQLRPALLQLRALGAVAPEPSPEVAALMMRAEAAPATTTAAAPVDQLAARRRAKRRAALTALSVAVSLTAGGAVAAASDQGFRDSFSQFHQAVTNFVTGSMAPAGHQAEEPAAPVPAIPTAPTTVPAAPAPAGQPVEAPPSDVQAPPEEATEKASTPGKPAGVPGADQLSTAVPDDVTNGGVTGGVGQQPQVTVPGASELPLPGTPPAVHLK